MATAHAGEAGAAAEEEAKPWVDDGSLPTDSNGTLPFYFFDAHEEPNAPGTLHFFGKVRPLQRRQQCMLCCHSRRKETPHLGCSP